MEHKANSSESDRGTQSNLWSHLQTYYFIECDPTSSWLSNLNVPDYSEPTILCFFESLMTLHLAAIVGSRSHIPKKKLGESNKSDLFL